MMRDTREPTSNRFGRATLACRDHNQKLHHGVIDLAAATLYNVDILVANRDANVDTGLAIGELA